MPEFECPQCHGSATHNAGLYHPVMVHWMLNPGLAFSELALGQVVARSSVSCAACTRSAVTGAGRYVQCADCGVYHPYAVWEGTNGFGNWLGMVCPDCDGSVPRVWNFLSLLVLACTFPVWWVVLKFKGERWRAAHQAKAQARRSELTALGSLSPSPTEDGPLVRGLTAQGHCPYCRDHVDASDGVACTSCFSRHHAECWDEHAECASCGNATRYTGVEETPGREAPKADPSKLKD